LSIQIFRWYVLDGFFGVLYWGGDYVVSAGPFAEVDDTAALAAERKVRIGVLYRFLADRAAEFDSALAGHARFYCRRKISGCRLKTNT
jgi:hypothetical protein